MAYVIFVHPGILSQTGMDKGALIAVTCIVTAAATMVVGLVANAPIAMAPGMGLNAFFAYTLVIGSEGRVSWQTALGVVFLSGLLFLVLTFVGLRRKLVEAIPQPLISAIAVGIGLFITFMGLQNLGIVVDSPATLVQAAPLTPTVLIGLAGLLVMLFCEMKRICGALLLGIGFSTLLAVIFGYAEPPAQWAAFRLPVSAVAFQLDIAGALKWSLMGSIFTLMFIDMFDSVGTLLAVAPSAGLVDEEGRVRNLDRLLAIDAGATMFGAVCGTSTTTAYIESASGIEQGGRTGLTAVVTGVLFLLAAFFVPVVAVVPAYATAPALIMVGLFMMKEVRRIDFADLEAALPAFVIIVMIALSYSISTGLAFGFIAYALVQTVAGKAGRVKPAMWVISALSILYFCIPADGGESMVVQTTIQVTSSAFEEGQMIPAKYTADGEDISPPLQWQGAPDGTESIVLISDDPDAPMGTWVHWVIYNMPPETTSLPEGVPPDETLENGGFHGTTDFHRLGYGGPAPPSGTHRYYFKLYALDTMLDLPPGATKGEVEKAMKRHILAQGDLMGKYKR